MTHLPTIIISFSLVVNEGKGVGFISQKKGKKKEWTFLCKLRWKNRYISVTGHYAIFRKYAEQTAHKLRPPVNSSITNC